MLKHVKAVHDRIKDIEYTHPDCDKTFSTTGNMLTHVNRVHDCIKEFQCTHPQCDQRFSAKYDMLKHVKVVHDGIRDIECTDPDCDKRFSDEGNMRKHVKAVHYGIREFKCTHSDCDQMKPVVFVRFNPDTREVDGEKERLKRADREDLLLEVLQDIGDGTIELSKPLNLVYIGYDMLDGEPVVCGDPDYDSQMRGCVVLAV